MKQDLRADIQNLLSNTSLEEEELLFQLQRYLHEAEIRTLPPQPTATLADLVAESVEKFSSAIPSTQVIRTGFKEIDALMGGFSPGELVVVGGRPSMGKTQLIINMLLNISLEVPVLYFTFDLSSSLLSSRFLSCAANVPIQNIVQQNLTQDERKLLVEQSVKLAKNQIFINDSCNSSIHALRAFCHKHIANDGVKVVCIDYLQMMGMNRYRHNRELEVSFISRELKKIAKDFQVCVIAMSQLSRSVEIRGGSRRPVLADLRESGAIEQDADKVLFVYRPEYYEIEVDEYGNITAGLTEVIVAKNRNGVLGSVKLQRSPNATHFVDFVEYPSQFNIFENRLKDFDPPF
jgi:replicative DNA helicase